MAVAVIRGRTINTPDLILSGAGLVMLMSCTVKP
jgi:hypothetical protein